jgi:hypothetical protein
VPPLQSIATYHIYVTNEPAEGHLLSSIGGRIIDI